jgi:enoyl-CoA hydratase/carnithine racemase
LVALRYVADAAVRAIIITGTGPAFCAGMDLTEARASLARGTSAATGTDWPEARHGEEVRDQVYNCGKPTIAAVNGVAVGNGARLVSVCDIALMASEARIGYPEMRLGIQAAMVVLHLMRLVGERVSRYLLLTGELIDAQTAQQIGLVNRVVPGNQLLEAAVDCAIKIGLNARQAEAKTKLLLRRFCILRSGLSERAHRDVRADGAPPVRQALDAPDEGEVICAARELRASRGHLDAAGGGRDRVRPVHRGRRR